MFGHARGAFTGAVSDRAGLVEEADGGTLFLDEVADLSARAQAKLLRVVQQQEVRRVGETFSRKIEVRLVSAANRDLRNECEQGRFRQDLLYRLDVIRVHIPSLRERPEDIPALTGLLCGERLPASEPPLSSRSAARLRSQSVGLRSRVLRSLGGQFAHQDEDLGQGWTWRGPDDSSRLPCLRDLPRAFLIALPMPRKYSLSTLLPSTLAAAPANDAFGQICHRISNSEY